MSTYQPRAGDIHITFKNGLYLIWSYSEAATPGAWLPTNSSRDTAYIQDYLATNRMMKVQETREAVGLEPMPFCGIYRQPASQNEPASGPFDNLSFEEEISPTNWTEETRLHTPTFEALLKSDGTLWLSGVALAEGFTVEATQALTRFLSERVKLPPIEPPYNFSDFTPKRVDAEESEH